jgi:hypothetical protein
MAFKYIYYMQATGSFLFLQDKNTLKIYFEPSSAKLNYEVCIQNVFNTIKMRYLLYTTMNFLDFHWKLTLTNNAT